MTNTTKGFSYWAEFPVTYRTEQVETIMQWVTAGESGVVVGGSGTGKSNLAGFLGSRPDAITPYVTGNPEQYCFLHLDINRLPMLTVPFFYRGLVQALQDTSESLGAEVQPAMQQLTQGQVNWDDLFQVLTILQKAYHLVIYQAGKQVVWLLDRFDEACLQLDAQTLSSLRSLRDQFKGKLCYVVFTRHPLSRLRDPREIDEFHEIVAANTCWVGPMVERDARWIARQMAERLHTTFAKPDVTQLIQVTGGLPAFMKLGCLALAEGGLKSGEAAQTWVKQLLDRPEFKRNCQEIWRDLTADEQAVLSAISDGVNDSLLAPGLTTAYLEKTGVLVGSQSGSQLSVFSPIFEAFIMRQRPTAPSLIEYDPVRGEVRRGGIVLDLNLTPHESRLLTHFLNHPGEICQKDDLMYAVWPNEVAIGDDRLAQLVKRLRQKIEPDSSQPTYIQTERGLGYQFVQPE
jgi:DNA-binding winged helix-turn-helix (wHTH) protein